jgi:hypothetical protein
VKGHVHLHHSSKKKSHKEITTVEIKVRRLSLLTVTNIATCQKSRKNIFSAESGGRAASGN